MNLDKHSLLNFQENKKNIRNFCILAHVDHGIDYFRKTDYCILLNDIM